MTDRDEVGMILGYIETLEKELEAGMATMGYFVTCSFADPAILPITFSFDPHDVEAFEKVRIIAVDEENEHGCAVYTKAQWLNRVLEENPLIPTVLETVEVILERISRGNPDSLVYYSLSNMLIASNRSIDFIIDNEPREAAVAN